MNTIKVEYDSEIDEFVLPISEEIALSLGWTIGDNILWIDNQDGSWTLKKKENKNG